MQHKEMIYASTKTTSRIYKVETTKPVKKIILMPSEAQYLINKGVAVYEDIMVWKDTTRTVYYCYADLDALSTIAQR